MHSLLRFRYFLRILQPLPLFPQTGTEYFQWLFNDISLQWRYNEHDSVSNHQHLNYLLSRLFRCRSKKTSKLRVTGFGEGNSRTSGQLRGKCFHLMTSSWIGFGLSRGIGNRNKDLRADAKLDICPKLILNPNLMKSLLPITYSSGGQSFWNFTWSPAVILLGSGWNVKAIAQRKRMLCTNEISRDLSSIWVLEGYQTGGTLTICKAGLISSPNTGLTK